MKKLLAMTALYLPLTFCPESAHAGEICSYAPSQSYVVNRITSGLGGVGTGALVVMQTTGLTMVADGGGSYALAGAGGAVAASSMAVPALIVVSVAAVGTGIALELGCIRENHPDTARKMGAFAESFRQTALAVFR